MCGEFFFFCIYILNHFWNTSLAKNPPCLKGGMCSWFSGLGLQSSRASPQGAQCLGRVWAGWCEWSPGRGAGQDEEAPCFVCNLYFEPYKWVLCLSFTLRKPLSFTSLSEEVNEVPECSKTGTLGEEIHYCRKKWKFLFTCWNNCSIVRSQHLGAISGEKSKCYCSPRGTEMHFLPFVGVFTVPSRKLVEKCSRGVSQPRWRK